MLRPKQVHELVTPPPELSLEEEELVMNNPQLTQDSVSVTTQMLQRRIIILFALAS